ncbi:hypothetical protein PV726_26945 [Streptomyces europaeiscabiei]|uniref:hypothetical protein n=1 Tax=Streptomyces europaeiscabiei TaxID=146819 RepID=UPI0029A3FEA8|nr:hypothetical protein [Streptomyces europaeiscabiei]MDX3693908.1 hypothetical protein [Streptomyces europaeiscabiei]
MNSRTTRAIPCTTLRAPLLREPPGERLCLFSLMRTAPPQDPDGVRRLVAVRRPAAGRRQPVGVRAGTGIRRRAAPGQCRADGARGLAGALRARLRRSRTSPPAARAASATAPISPVRAPP